MHFSGKAQKTWIPFLKKLTNHGFHFLQAEKAHKTWISFFASWKGFIRISSPTYCEAAFYEIRKARLRWVGSASKSNLFPHGCFADEETFGFNLASTTSKISDGSSISVICMEEIGISMAESQEDFQVQRQSHSSIMDFIFCKLKKTQKTWISFFFFCKLKKPQKTWISFFASLKNLKKHEFHFLQA